MQSWVKYHGIIFCKLNLVASLLDISYIKKNSVLMKISVSLIVKESTCLRSLVSFNSTLISRGWHCVLWEACPLGGLFVLWLWLGRLMSSVIYSSRLFIVIM